MKKLLAALLAVLMIFVFTGCGDDSSSLDLDKLFSSSDETFSVTSRDEISLPSATIADTETSSAPALSTSFTKGSTVGNVYTNNWANIKFELSGNWKQGDTSAYSAYESAANTYCGLIAKDEAAIKQLDIAFEKLTGLNTAMSADGYIDVITELFDKQYKENGMTFTVGETFNQTIANETYRSFIIDFSTLGFIQHISVRKLDSYIIFITVTATDKFTSNTVLNSIRTAY